MQKFKIGVMSDSFRLELKQGIRKAAEVGAEGIQIYAVSGEMDPENLDAASRKDLLKYIRDCGLKVSALCGDLGGHGFSEPRENEWKIEKSKKIMELAVELDTTVVTTHIGVVPNDEDSAKYKTMLDACAELAAYGDRLGAYFAIETGPENTQRLKNFLDKLGSSGVSVNYDPANLAMVAGDDPVQGVYSLGKYIVHTHAKDGIMKKKGDPEKIYGAFADGNPDGLNFDDFFIETPLGEGSVDFTRYLKALEETGYSGYLTIEREVGDSPEKDIRMAIEFLRKLI